MVQLSACNCSGPGYCDDHRRRMNETRWRQCKYEKGYYEAFQKDRKKREEEGEVDNQGLGDTIDKITEKTGIKKAVKKIWRGCGCEKRRKRLNKLFPAKNTKKDK